MQINERKLFKKNSDMIFEQDFAQPHSTKANQEFMEESSPAHTPTLWRYQDEYDLFFGAKWGDFWSIERLWGYILKECIEIHGLRTLMASCGGSEKKLGTRTQRHWFGLFTSFQAKMNEIFRQKGKRIPSNFDPQKSPFACKCEICTSWDEMFNFQVYNWL